jgi:5-methylcytosine-specific restriction endonuclease McrA
LTVNKENISTRFFEVEQKDRSKGIILTDNLFLLNESKQFNNFNYEVEARWRLVETAWSLNISPSLLQVHYDEETNLFYVDKDIKNRRIDITSSRDSLNGYQKGKCFYCFADISVEQSDDNLADVDHFFPFILQKEVKVNLNGLWNLVLACKSCNRGQNGKFEKIPDLKYLERLYKRNEFFIESHHPLKETLINQTGKTPKQRKHFLQQMYKQARNYIVSSCWKPVIEYEPAF